MSSLYVDIYALKYRYIVSNHITNTVDHEACYGKQVIFTSASHNRGFSARIIMIAEVHVDM